MKVIIRLLIAALVINACWQAGRVYLRYYRFKDEVQQIALFATNKSEGDLQKRFIEIANELGVPLAPENVSVRRTENHTLIEARYTERVQIVPTYFYPYEFKM